MKTILPFKLIIVTGALAAILTGCFNNSDSTMQGMDHSKMGQSMDPKAADKPGQPAGGSTSKNETLNGKEINLTAKTSNLDVMPGKTIPVWTFNNSVPGPEIRVKQGETAKINLKNELPDPVTIHWHGVPVPNAMDGIPGVTQNAVQPGQSFIYEFKADVPGTYWYHSHQDGVNQVDKGLYGSFIVETADDKVNRDYTLILDEWNSAGVGNMDMSSKPMPNMDMSNMDHSKMNMGGSAEQPKQETQSTMDHGNMNMDTTAEGSPKASTMAGHDMNTMYDLFTINGKSGEAIDKLIVKQGEKVRIRLINAGFMSHNMHLHGQEFKVTATDGQPINNPGAITDQLIAIAPGERYDLEFEATTPGQWYLEEHGKEAPVKGMKAMIQYEGSEGSKDQANETAELPMLDITKYGQASQSKFSLDQNFNLEYTMNLNTEAKNGEQVYTINDKAFPDTEAIKVKKGDLVKVRLVNNSKTDDHPMHLHGHFFQVLSKNGKPMEGSPIIKDSLNLKPGEEYVVAFEADNPGDWMFHCHDLHHASAGMMTHLVYSDFKSNFVNDPKAGNKPE
ncbi:multicopper oxidase family protein [Paenibacillus sp. S3N08]|uniref:Multicopper oxidase family protein n=1 Tax=Paenibacillus agricola TaxID=2716264 RepID=A0ABX0JA89_9BACL|nr:multicopper oxidase family protein [Paenibacillus agricola]NHN33299.1 multicopper oxidase family protein [Paenibacillus agricola]